MCIYSRLEFCKAHLAKHILALENVKLCVIRMIPGLGDMAYEDRLKRLTLPIISSSQRRYDRDIRIYDMDVTTVLFNLKTDINTRGQQTFKARPRL